MAVRSRTFKYSQYLKGLLGNAIVTTDDRDQERGRTRYGLHEGHSQGAQLRSAQPWRVGLHDAEARPDHDPVAAANELRILKFFVENKCTRKNGIGYIDVQKIKSTASIVRNAFQTTPFAYQDLYASGFVKTTSCRL